jgi:quercetin dioxygenase-like cupin family protein
MKVLLAMMVLLAAGFVLIAADASRPAPLYVDHDAMSLKLKSGGQVTRTPTYSVSASHRDKAGQVEVHEKETDVFYVTDGQATFVVGGEMVGGKLTRPNQYLGDDIRGGETHNLSKGDVLVIPAGTPHWFKAVPGEVSYFVVKVIQE